MCERDPIQSTSGAQHAAVTAEGRITQESLQGRVSRTTSAQPCVDQHLVQENQYVKILFAKLNDLPLFYTWSGTIEGDVSGGQQPISTTERPLITFSILIKQTVDLRFVCKYGIKFNDAIVVSMLIKQNQKKHWKWRVSIKYSSATFIIPVYLLLSYQNRSFWVAWCYTTQRSRVFVLWNLK